MTDTRTVVDALIPLLDRLDRLEKRLEALEKLPKQEVHQHFHYQQPPITPWINPGYPYKYGSGGTQVSSVPPQAFN